MVESMCGCICSTCEFVEKCGCKGCFARRDIRFTESVSSRYVVWNVDIPIAENVKNFHVRS